MKIAEIAAQWDMLIKDVKDALISHSERLHPEYAILLYMLGDRECRITELAGGNQSYAVRHLENMRFIEVESDPADKRGKLVRITKEGKRIQDILRKLEARRA